MERTALLEREAAAMYWKLIHIPAKRIRERLHDDRPIRRNVATILVRAARRLERRAKAAA